MRDAPEVAAIPSGGGLAPEVSSFLAAATIAARAVRDDTTYDHPDRLLRLINTSVERSTSMLTYYQHRR